LRPYLSIYGRKLHLQAVPAHVSTEVCLLQAATHLLLVRA